MLLPDLPPDLGLPERDVAADRQWRFDRTGGTWTINGLPFGAEAFIDGRHIDFEDPADEGRIDASPALGTTEIWELKNPSPGWRHPIHPHLVRFRVLTRNGAAPRPYETEGRKDTVILGPNEVVRVLIQFGDYDGRFVLHRHNLEHEDHDMMTQFKVVR